MRDPRRLSDDPSAGELARALREASELGSRERVASAWQRIEPVLDRVPAAPIDASSGISALTKGVLVACTLALGTVGWLALAPAAQRLDRARSSPVAPVSAPSAPVPAAVVSTPSFPSPTPTLSQSQPLTIPPPSTVAPRPTARTPRAQRATSRPAAAAAVATAPATTDAEGELALLTRAQEQLEVAPAAALVLLGEHAQRYERGVLVQERELMRIDAERALGRSESAAARAQAFITRFPRSPQRVRLQTWLRTRSQDGFPAAEADKP